MTETDNQNLLKDEPGVQTNDIIGRSIDVPTAPVSNSNPTIESQPHKPLAQRLPLVFASLLAFILVIAGILMWQYARRPKLVPTTTTSAASQPSYDYTAWRPFVDTARAYELKFPPNFIAAGHTDNGLGPSNAKPVDPFGMDFYSSTATSMDFSAWAFRGDSLPQIASEWFYGGAPSGSQALTIHNYPAAYYQQAAGSSTTYDYVLYHNGVGVVLEDHLANATNLSAAAIANETTLLKQMAYSVNFTVPTPDTTFASYFTAASPSDHLNIPQLGVVLPEDSTLKGMYEVWDGQNAWLFSPSIDQTAHFQEPAICKSDPVTTITNTVLQDHMPLGYLAAGLGGPDDLLDASQIGGKDFVLRGANVGCSSSTIVLNTLQATQISLVEAFDQAKSL